MIRRAPRHDDLERDKPDVAAARETLERIKAQRPDVDALVASLVSDMQLNNFTANVIASFRGGRT